MDFEPREVAGVLRDQMHALEELLADADDDLCAHRPVRGAWSVKETLSHLIGPPGESYLDGVRRILIEDNILLDLEPGVTHYTADRQARSIGELLEAVTAQYLAIADVIEIAGEESLRRRAYIDLLPQTPSGKWLTLGEYVTVMAEKHLATHLDAIRERIEGDGMPT